MTILLEFVAVIASNYELSSKVRRISCTSSTGTLSVDSRTVWLSKLTEVNHLLLKSAICFRKLSSKIIRDLRIKTGWSPDRVVHRSLIVTIVMVM